MAKKHNRFRDEHSEDLAAAHMSDADLERLIAFGGARGVGGGMTPAVEAYALTPGMRLDGTVINVRGGEVLVELSSKAHGLIEDGEFEDEAFPAPGTVIRANFVRYDPARELAILSVKEARTEILWEELRAGMVLKGLVTDVNRGGLVLTIKDVRAFMPVSQIDRERVEDPSEYLGKSLRCEVTSFDRARKDLVVSRRVILEREAQERRGEAIGRLSEGDVLDGTVVRLTKFGAFIDVGGVEGLLHQSAIVEQARQAGGANPLAVGSRLQVQVTRVDPGRGRVALGFAVRSAARSAARLEGYAPGDVVAGWVTAVTGEGVQLSVDEGVEAFIAAQALEVFEEPVRRGQVITGTITRVDGEKNRLELTPGAGEPGD